VKGGIFAFYVCGFVVNAWQHTPKEVPPFALKKGAVNTPSVISFFANENGGFEIIFKNRRASLLPISATINQLPQLRFFLFPV